MPNKLWVEVYRPDTIDGYVFQNEEHKRKIAEYIKQQSIPHLLFKGVRGTGKTTLALILKKELGVEDGDFKVLNASDDNSVETIRTSIKNFAKSMPLGDFKIILLDEADYLTKNAQAALRRMMEEYSDTVRFILTCNYPHKVEDAVKSRCQEFTFSAFEKPDMCKHVFHILKKEGVKLTKDDAEKIKEYVDDAYPDMRKLLINLESNIKDNTLLELTDSDELTQVFVDIVDQLSKGKWLEVKDSVVAGVEDNEWDEIYTFLSDILDEVEGFEFPKNIKNWKKGMVIIGDHAHRNVTSAHRALNFTNCMIKLSNIGDE